jgi:tetratricopeptide (TPR) repeat protein
VSSISGGRSRVRQHAEFFLLVSAVALAALALFVAWRSERRVTLDPNQEVTVTEAEAILERANDAVNFADGVLSFLEGVSVLVAIGVTAGALLVRSTIQNQAEAMTRFAEDTERRLAEREQRLDEMESAFTQRLEGMVSDTRREIQAVKEQARESFRVLSLLVLAEQQVRARNIDTALEMLNSARELDPDNHAANYLLGYLYTARREYDRAIELLEQALEQEAGFTPAIAALGLALRRKGDTLDAAGQQAERDHLWAAAESKLIEALHKDPRLTDADGESYYGTLGGLYRRQKRYHAAIDAYEQAHRVTPNSSYPIINLATLYHHQGSQERAAHYFQRVIDAAVLQLDDDPRDQWTRADYAQALLAAGNVDAALGQLQTLIDQGVKRGLLETVRSGLEFLGEAPEPVNGLDAMLHLVDSALETTT